MSSRTVDVPALIEGRRFGPTQALLAALCLLVVTLDGFNAQVMGYVAPALLKTFHIKREALGPVISSGLFGLMLGAFILGFLGDRLGRKLVIVVSVAVFGTFSILTSFAHTPSQMLWLRFLTGIGLGGAMPSAIALVSEYVPSRMKTTVVTVVVSGFAIGPALGGFVVGPLMRDHGWSTVFLVGGVLPLLLLPLLWLLLPESSRLMSARGDAGPRIARNLKRMFPDADLPPDGVYVEPHGAPVKAPLREVFSDGRGAGSLLLWAAVFFNLIGINLQTSWLPVMITSLGYPLAKAVTATAGFQVGGAIGGLTLAWALGKFDSLRVTVVVFLLAAVAIAMIGPLSGSLGALRFAIFLAGLFVVGGQCALNAMTGLLYPASIRATGSGWALGVGRFGAALGPLAGSALAGLHLPMKTLFYVEGAPFVVCAVAVFLLRESRQGRAAAAAQSGSRAKASSVKAAGLTQVAFPE